MPSTDLLVMTEIRMQGLSLMQNQEMPMSGCYWQICCQPAMTCCRISGEKLGSQILPDESTTIPANINVTPQFDNAILSICRLSNSEEAEIKLCGNLNVSLIPPMETSCFIFQFMIVDTSMFACPGLVPRNTGLSSALISGSGSIGETNTCTLVTGSITDGSVSGPRFRIVVMTTPPLQSNQPIDLNISYQLCLLSSPGTQVII